MDDFLTLSETWGIQCQFWHLLPFLAFSAFFGSPCRMWHLMRKMEFNAKNGMVPLFCVENVLIHMLGGIKCKNRHHVLKSALNAK
jgi:hypothetical protein